MECNCSACVSQKAYTAQMPDLPTFTCKTHTTWLADYCLTCQSSELSNFILIVGMGQQSLVQDYMAALPWEKKYVLEAALKTGIRKDVPQAYFGVLAAYGAYAPGSSVFAGSDLHCATCDTTVSNLTDSDHWDVICGDCGYHEDSDECEKCPTCEDHLNTGYGCSCCGSCGNAPGYCVCCDYCGESEDDCECEYCEDCGYKGGGCGCSSTPYRFGSTKDVPWESNDPKYAPMDEVPSMSDVDKGVDPVRSAADYYLLDAIIGLTRMSEVVVPEQFAQDWLDRDRLVRNDDMLSAILVSAKRSHADLVDRLDRNFLAYAISAVGGELRYHRALSSGPLSMSRSSSWDQFVEIVKEKGAAALFDAEVLFEEFGSGSYGGHKWAVAAKIVGQRLSGNMPAWLYVDRMFTLEHNGGCFLNKVQWSTNNELGYGLHHMKRVLDAHAGLCRSCNKRHESGPNCDGLSSYTGYDLLMKVASPGVTQMFKMAETRIARLARRFCGELEAIVPSGASKQDRNRPCPWCGYYACVC
jgi:hypothetical protein